MPARTYTDGNGERIGSQSESEQDYFNKFHIPVLNTISESKMGHEHWDFIFTSE